MPCPTWYPTVMKKTSVYLSEEDDFRLDRLAKQLRLSRADVIRLAIEAYVPPSREFLLDGCVEGDGSSIADVPDEDLMRGFGEA